MLWRILRQSLFFRAAVLVSVVSLLVAAVIGGLEWHGTFTLLRHGVHTTASVAAVDSYTDSDSDTRYKLLVAFTDGHGVRQTHWIMDLNAGDVQAAPGESVAVLYDPADPGNVNLEQRVQFLDTLANVFIVAPIALALLLLGAAVWHAHGRLRFLRRGVAVLGTVTSLTTEVHGRGEDAQTRYHLHYTFRTEGGVTRRGSAGVTPSVWRRYDSGGPISVVYDPVTWESTIDTIGLHSRAGDRVRPDVAIGAGE